MDQLPEIGKNLKKERQARKLSLEELSEKSGVSKAMLSQIESGKVNPTVATLWKIAQALRVDFNVLLKGGESEIKFFQVSRHEDLVRLDTEDDGVHISVLSPVSQTNDLEMYLLTFRPGSSLQSSAHASGTEEFLTVLSGAVDVSAGKNAATLRQGDVIAYQCDVNHSITQQGDESACIHMVVRFGVPDKNR